MYITPEENGHAIHSKCSPGRLLDSADSLPMSSPVNAAGLLSPALQHACSKEVQHKLLFSAACHVEGVAKGCLCLTMFNAM